MSYKERILDYLWSVAPDGATNGQLARALGITSQQTVYMTTQELAGRRLIRAAKEGATWVFYALDAQADDAVRASTASAARAGLLTPAGFEALAGRVLGERYEVNGCGRRDPETLRRTRWRFGWRYGIIRMFY